MTLQSKKCANVHFYGENHLCCFESYYLGYFSKYDEMCVIHGKFSGSFQCVEEQDAGNG